MWFSSSTPTYSAKVSTFNGHLLGRETNLMGDKNRSPQRHRGAELFTIHSPQDATAEARRRRKVLYLLV